MPLFDIDPEVRELLPRPSEEDRKNLLNLLLSDGCRDALCVGIYPGLDRPILTDGHTRYELCEANDITYRVSNPRKFDSRDHLLQWIIDTQLGRRNLTDEQRAYYRGKDYLLARKEHGNPLRFQGSAPSGQNVHLGAQKTAESVAEKHNVSDRTIRRDAEYAAALDEIGEKEPEKKQEILNGHANISKLEVIRAAKPRKKKSRAKVVAEASGEKEAAVKEYFADPNKKAEHEHAEFLNKTKAYAAFCSGYLDKLPADSKMRLYFMMAGIARARDIQIGDKHYGWQFLALRGTYRLASLAGKRGTLDKKAIQKAYQIALTGEE